MRVNVTALYNTCRTYVPDMIRAGGGQILNVSSVWGLCGASCEVAYSASKGAVNAFTKALATMAQQNQFFPVLQPMGRKHCPQSCLEVIAARFLSKEKRFADFQQFKAAAEGFCSFNDLGCEQTHILDDIFAGSLCLGLDALFI